MNGANQYFINLLQNLKNAKNDNANDLDYIREILNEYDLVQDTINIYGDEFYQNNVMYFEEINQIYFKNIIHTMSGIIIAGYGDDELWPAICEINVSECRNNKLMSLSHFEKNPNGKVYTFAQSDMADTLLYGMSAEIIEKTSDIIKKY